MLLNSIFFLILLITLKIKITVSVIVLFMAITFIKNKKIIFPEKRYFITFAFMSFVIQIIYNQEGKVILGNTTFAITEIGIISGLSLIVKIYGMILISRNTDFKKVFNGRLKKQALIFDVVVKIIPEIVKLPKTIISPGKMVKFILKKVYREIK